MAFFYSNKLDHLVNLLDFNADTSMGESILVDYHLSREEDIDASKIRFSWELSAGDFNSLTEILHKTIVVSKNVVIIGYTFPVYNRFIDLQYLKQDTIIGRKMFIQDPDADSLKQNFLDYYKINHMNDFKEKLLIPIKNCDSFYVPSDVFGIDEYQSSFNIDVR